MCCCRRWCRWWVQINNLIYIFRNWRAQKIATVRPHVSILFLCFSYNLFKRQFSALDNIISSKVIRGIYTRTLSIVYTSTSLNLNCYHNYSCLLVRRSQASITISYPVIAKFLSRKRYNYNITRKLYASII